MPPTSITLTGADEATPLDWIRQAVNRPDVEIGLLLSASPEGRHRYPSREWLHHAAAAAQGRAALHVCGGTARSWLQQGKLPGLVSLCQRIQVNGKVGTPGIGVLEIEELCAQYPHNTIITQHCPGNEILLKVDAPNHALLVDASGGRGIAPGDWQRPAGAKAVGLAGGLGPDTLAMQLPAIAKAAAGHGFWVDMESRLRSPDDWFDRELADRSIDVFLDWRSAARVSRTTEQAEIRS